MRLAWTSEETRRWASLTRKRRHHFLLFADGGAIQIVPKDAKDMASVEAIRSHLKMIAPMFQRGNFELPMFIHDAKVPGTEVMKRRQKAIHYRYVQIPRGAEVLMETRDKEAVKAIHAFLRFQIKDHRTGDSGRIVER